MPLVTGAEGDGAVEQLQQMGDAGGAGQGAGGEKDLQALGQTDQTFQEAAQDQEPPAQVAGHAVRLGPGGRRQLHRQPVQGRQDLGHDGQALLRRAQAAGEDDPHALHQRPVFGGQPVAQGQGDPFQGLEVEGDARDQPHLRPAGRQAPQQGPFVIPGRDPRTRLPTRNPDSCSGPGKGPVSGSGTNSAPGNGPVSGSGANSHSDPNAGPDQTGPDAQGGQGLQQGPAGGAVVGDEQQGGPRQAHLLFGPLGIAPQPEEVLPGAAAEGTTATAHLVHGQLSREQGKGIHRPLRQHPGVQTGTAALHGDAGLLAAGHPGHAARQELPAALAIGDGIDPHQGGAEPQAPALPEGRAGEAQPALDGPGIRVQPDARRVRGEHRRGPPPLGKGAPRPFVVQPVLDRVPGRRLAAPPGGQGGQEQLLIEQPAGNRGQEAEDRRRLQDGAAQGVGHHHLASADDLHQAGHTQGRIRAQLQGIAPVVVDPAQQTLNRFQPLHRLQPQPVVPHLEIAALDQGETQIAGQIGLLVPGLAVRARGQQGQPRRLAAGQLPRRPLDGIQ